MKKIRIYIIVVFFYATSVGATESGVPGFPLSNFGLTGGIGFSYIYRPLQNKEGYADSIKSFQILLRGGIGITNYLNFFIMGGLNDARKKVGGFKGTLSPFYGVGARLVILSQNFTITNLYVEGDTTYSEISGIENGKVGTLYWVKFDGKIGISKFLKNYIALYGGFKYSYQRIKFAQSEEMLHSQLPWGVFIGADYFVTPFVFFEAEMHNFDQDALFLLVGTKF